MGEMEGSRGEMIKKEPFKPFPLCTSCHLQTIAAFFLSMSGTLPSSQRFIKLPDGDQIALEISTPLDWNQDEATAILVHGLCGSSRSSYITRVARKLYKRNVRTIRLNLRGCGLGRGHGRKIYHSGSSEDIWHVLKEIKSETPSSPLTLIGFSLGGNTILKTVGEKGNEAKQWLDKVISISPPIDMESSIRLLSKNAIYERYFMSYLREDVEYLHTSFNDLPPIRIPSDMSLLDFNEFYIAPQSGHQTARDYYDASSSARLIKNIAVPCHLLFARDDPIVDCRHFDFTALPSNVKVMMTDNGGHLGYLGVPGQQGGFYWMDSTVLEWVFQKGARL